MTLKEIHDFILFMLDKEINGFATSEEIDMALDWGSMAAFNQYVAYYAETQKFQDALAPFKKPFSFTNSTSIAGKVILPDDYLRLLSVSLLKYDNDLQKNLMTEIEVLNDDELVERLRSQLKPVNENNPVIQWIGKGKFQIYPKTMNVGEGWYLKRPDKPKLEYYQSGREVTYDEFYSTELEWGEGEVTNVIYRALQFLGVNLSSEQMIQYTQLKLTDA